MERDIVLIVLRVICFRWHLVVKCLIFVTSYKMVLYAMIMEKMILFITKIEIKAQPRWNRSLNNEISLKYNFSSRPHCPLSCTYDKKGHFSLL